MQSIRVLYYNNTIPPSNAHLPLEFCPVNTTKFSLLGFHHACGVDIKRHG